MNKRRGLDKEFMEDLKNSKLKEVLQAVKGDDTLCLEIRDNYVNIYYRGGNLLKIERCNNNYKVYFDFKYFNNSNTRYKDKISDLDSYIINDWVDSIPFLKYEMDAFFSQNSRLEREFQQLVVRQNNSTSIASDTDYYIADIEYANSSNGSKFDLVAIKWRSIGQDRKKGDVPTLSLIEMKYGDDQLSGKAGLVDHIKDFYKFIKDVEKLETLYGEAETMFNQKYELGLIPSINKNISINRRKNLEIILLISNHKPASTILCREIEKIFNLEEYKILKSENFEIKVAHTSVMGYGLYDSYMMTLECFYQGLINEVN